ncbi:MAG: hypothetical protein ACREKJ_01240, partial [Candidatus Rokuibacteriota bacterium]
MASAVQDLVGRGVLVQRPGGWCLTERPEALEVALPDDVRGVIALQFGRLAGDEQRVLEVASVAGLEFSAASVGAGAAADVEARCAALARPAAFLVARGTDTRSGAPAAGSPRPLGHPVDPGSARGGSGAHAPRDGAL